jgi:8-oxo-dGTP pyrophosphatase MutT (NUDIX family)
VTKPRTRIDYWHDPRAPKPTSRKASASAFVRDPNGRLLLLRRTDNNLWTIPTGAIKKNETVGQAASRECLEETGIIIEITGLVGVFSDPGHVIAYRKGGKTTEVRQPINLCLRAIPTGGNLSPSPDEASEVRWVDPNDLDSYEIHPAILTRITHGLADSTPAIA